MTADVHLRRGDVVWVNLDPVVGHEIGRRRPALVVQNDVGNRLSPTVIIAAITEYKRRKARFPFCTVVPSGVGGLRKKSVVNGAQLRTVDKRRIAERPLGHLPEETMGRVDEALKVSLALE